MGVPLVALLCLLAGSLLTGCMSASIGKSTAQNVNHSSDGLPALPVVGARDYRVGALDLLEIMVFGSEQLSRTVRVTAAGELSLPLIGLVKVQGMSVAEVQDTIAKQLAERYLENPQVSVFVKEYMSQRVTVEGAVRNPGVFALTGRTSLLQMVALSGGLDRDANPAGIVIYRSIEDRRRAAVFDLRKIRAGEIVDPEVLGSDVVVVDYSGIRSSLHDLLTAAPLLAVFLTVL